MPKFKNVSEMETAAMGEADNTVSLKLGEGANWLRVEFVAIEGFFYYHDVMGRPMRLERSEAQELIDLAIN